VIPSCVTRWSSLAPSGRVVIEHAVIGRNVSIVGKPRNSIWLTTARSRYDRSQPANRQRGHPSP
jgi:hypothetical protein